MLNEEILNEAHALDAEATDWIALRDAIVSGLIPKHFPDVTDRTQFAKTTTYHVLCRMIEMRMAADGEQERWRWTSTR